MFLFFIARSDLRTHSHCKDNRAVDRGFSHRTTRKKAKEAILQESISLDSITHSSAVANFPLESFSQHLEDIRVRSSNRFSASNQPQVMH